MTLGERKRPSQKREERKGGYRSLTDYRKEEKEIPPRGKERSFFFFFCLFLISFRLQLRPFSSLRHIWHPRKKFFFRKKRKMRAFDRFCSVWGVMHHWMQARSCLEEFAIQKLRTFFSYVFYLQCENESLFLVLNDALQTERERGFNKNERCCSKNNAPSTETVKEITGVFSSLSFV